MDYDKEEILEDLKNLIDNYWYILQNWSNKGTPFPQEIEKSEKWIKDMAAKYHAF
jgi:hypothetical protein